MTQYKYLMIHRRENADNPIPSQEEMDAIEGNFGWELVHTDRTPDGACKLYRRGLSLSDLGTPVKSNLSKFPCRHVSEKTSNGQGSYCLRCGETLG